MTRRLDFEKLIADEEEFQNLIHKGESVVLLSVVEQIP
ncbi:hypothetical protein AVEN_110775-1, partial [Araneus ventricosus]